jgi:hypothetical protein
MMLSGSTLLELEALPVRAGGLRCCLAPLCISRGCDRRTRRWGGLHSRVFVFPGACLAPSAGITGTVTGRLAPLHFVLGRSSHPLEYQYNLNGTKSVPNRY